MGKSIGMTARELERKRAQLQKRSSLNSYEQAELSALTTAIIAIKQCHFLRDNVIAKNPDPVVIERLQTICLAESEGVNNSGTRFPLLSGGWWKFQKAVKDEAGSSCEVLDASGVERRSEDSGAGDGEDSEVAG